MRSWWAGVLAVCLACCTSEPVADVVCAEEPQRPLGLAIAGSGATIPLVRLLLDDFVVDYPDQPVWVAESIGTGGAVRALRDGAIDLGLASRPVDRDGIAELVVARAAIEVGVHPDVPDPDVSWEFLLQAARGDQLAWTDGSPVVFVHRESGDSGVRAVAADSPALGDAIVLGQAQALIVAYTDADATHLLATVPGAIGLFDPMAARLLGERVQTLNVSGAPEWTRPLSVFWLADNEPADLLAYLAGAFAQARITRLGYLLP